MLDRAQFLRPIAHRGLHDARRGLVENTGPAFAAALASGYGIECDLRPAAGGLPIVFHDETLERLVDATGPVSELSAAGLARLCYRGHQDTRILTFAELLGMAGGRVPLLVEIKSEWEPPDHGFIAQIAALARNYTGPLALMSFDPAVMEVVRALAPGLPRGIISGGYKDEDGETWWPDKIDESRAARLANLLEHAAVEPDFIAYHVKSLPSPATEMQRHAFGLPLFTWTVRTPEDRAIAARWADAPIFEGFEA